MSKEGQAMPKPIHGDVTMEPKGHQPQCPLKSQENSCTLFFFSGQVLVSKKPKSTVVSICFFFLLKSSVCLEAISTFTCKTGHWLSVAKEILDERQAERVREESPW